MPKPIMEQDLFYVTTMMPGDVTPEMLGCAPHIRQVRVFARAASRAEFGRKLVASGILASRTSPAAASAYAKNWGSTTSNVSDHGAITDDRVYVHAIDGQHGTGFIAYPLEGSTPTA
jgi:hypothetical protein